MGVLCVSRFHQTSRDAESAQSSWSHFACSRLVARSWSCWRRATGFKRNISTREKLTNVPQIQLEVRAAYGSQVEENAVFLFELTCLAVAASFAASFRSWIAVSIQIDSEGERLLGFLLFFHTSFCKRTLTRWWDMRDKQENRSVLFIIFFAKVVMFVFAVLFFRSAREGGSASECHSSARAADCCSGQDRGR